MQHQAERAELVLLSRPVICVAAGADADQRVVDQGRRVAGELVSKSEGVEASFAVPAVQDAGGSLGVRLARLPGGSVALKGLTSLVSVMPWPLSVTTTCETAP
ncbi:hypothetical protein ACFYT4_28515 [Streptomyces sp. NPDC004609]|uniref:hypothetical protein n=1 Tax=Streptomyces sp. NPDC004609 TaxID=3364704 RepID=UPI00369C080E